MTRISSDPTDAGYSQFVVAKEHEKEIIVFLDGQEVKMCSVADEEQGFVIRCVPDERGGVQVDPTDDNTIWTERVTGHVEVRFE